MGIWIRSQNKCKLVRCREFFIYDDCNASYDIVGHGLSDISIILGTYSSKEKAIKVLDMIQKHISPSVKIPQTNIRNIDDDLVYRPNKDFEHQSLIGLFNDVFEIPQDNEVEV